MQQKKPSFEYKCSKCGNNYFRLEEMRGASGALAAAFDIENRKISLVICTRCTFADCYAMPLRDFKERFGLDRSSSQPSAGEKSKLSDWN